MYYVYIFTFLLIVFFFLRRQKLGWVISQGTPYHNGGNIVKGVQRSKSNTDKKGKKGTQTTNKLLINEKRKRQKKK
jgi:hypothetical protein